MVLLDIFMKTVVLLTNRLLWTLNLLMKKRKGKAWRDLELTSTDWIVPVTDHPKHAAYITYRKALRDWPSTADFPNKRPVLG